MNKCALHFGTFLNHEVTEKVSTILVLNSYFYSVMQQHIALV